MANSNTDCLDWVWEMRTVERQDPFQVTTDAEGTVWVIVGTDSGFEARTGERWIGAEPNGPTHPGRRSPGSPLPLSVP